jgi:hypothetical protein
VAVPAAGSALPRRPGTSCRSSGRVAIGSVSSSHQNVAGRTAFPITRMRARHRL